MKQITEAPKESLQFKDLGINEEILRILDRNSWKVPTPIQNKVIPSGLEGKDIIGIAQTGTGKTLGFGIPLIQQVILSKKMGVIVVPTRELAIQVHETMQKLALPLKLWSSVLIGGEPIYKQLRDLRNNPEIIIATPGRLLDHVKQGSVRLERFNILVLDEADHMFDIGFLPQIKEIIKKLPKERQTLLFSATMPEAIASLAVEHMKLPFRIEVAPSGTTAEKVEQEIFVVAKQAKFSLLVKLLGEYPGPVLVFTRTKHGAKDVALALRDTGFTATEIHSNRSLGQRKEAISGFKTAKYRVMVATDIAARGIDVKEISLVVNYDLPEQTEDYVHRIGRTGRAGHTGKAITFAMPDQHRDIVLIERLIKKTLPVKSHAGATIIRGSSFRPGRRAFGGGDRKRTGFKTSFRSQRPISSPSNQGRSGKQFQRGYKPFFQRSK